MKPTAEGKKPLYNGIDMSTQNEKKFLMEMEPLMQLLIANIPSWISCGECWYGILTYCNKRRNENQDI